jgi:hypothetical protein
VFAFLLINFLYFQQDPFTQTGLNDNNAQYKLQPAPSGQHTLGKSQPMANDLFGIDFTASSSPTLQPHTHPLPQMAVQQIPPLRQPFDTSEISNPMTHMPQCQALQLPLSGMGSGGIFQQSKSSHQAQFNCMQSPQASMFSHLSPSFATMGSQPRSSTGREPKVSDQLFNDLIPQNFGK